MRLKKNYKIIQTTSSAYDPDCSKWKVTYEPSNQATTTKKPNCDNIGKNSKTKTINSKSSSEDELSDFSEDEDEDEDEEEDKNAGKCLLKFKK